MARQSDVIGGVPILASWGNTVRDRSVVPFTNAAERTSQWATPPEGAMSYLADVDTLYTYSGTVWVATGAHLPRMDATRTDSAGNRSASGSYANWNGTETCAVTMVKQRADTNILLEVWASVSQTSGFLTYIGVNVSGGTGDLDVARLNCGTVPMNNLISGIRKITGLAAASYTYTLRWRTTGSTSITVDDYACLKVTETL